jgi:hypothetical protein
MRDLRARLSYANVVSTLALVLAVGTGGAWAATTIHGKLIKKNTVTGNKLKKNTLGTREVNETKLGRVPMAAGAEAAAFAELSNNSNTLGGIGPSGFVQGGGTQSSGRFSGPAGDNPNVLKTFQTPVGEFRLGCGNASADVRYFNTTPGDADVFRASLGEANDTTMSYEVEASGDTGGVGYASNGGAGPRYVDIRAGKGEQVAILRVGQRREGLTCIWNWELVAP